MIEPPPAAASCGIAAWVAKTMLLRLTAITRSQASSVISRMPWRGSDTPTLFWRMSSRPYRSTAAATIRSHWSRFVTSAATATAVPPLASIAATVSAARSTTWSTQTTLAPSRANRIDVALPLPTPSPREPAPVTSATFPFKRSAIAAPPSSDRRAVLAGGDRDGTSLGSGEAGGAASGDRFEYHARLDRGLGEGAQEPLHLAQLQGGQ